MSTDYKHRKFEEALRYHKSDEDIREAARDLAHSSFDTKENAEFIKEKLEEYKHGQTRSFGDEARYDGIQVRTGSFARIRVEDEPEPEPEYHPPKRIVHEDDEDDEDDEEIEHDEDFNDDDETDWEDE